MASPSSYYGVNFGVSPVPLTTFKYGGPAGGLSNQSYPEIDPFSFMKGDDYLKATPENQGFMRQYQLQALQGRDMANLFKQKDFNIEGIKDFMKTQAEISRDIAKDKFKDEASFGMMMTGVRAAADGLQTAIAGGSPPMLAYNTQARLREGQAYIRNSQNSQRQEIGQQPVPPYMYPKFFNVG